MAGLTHSRCLTGVYSLHPLQTRSGTGGGSWAPLTLVPRLFFCSSGAWNGAMFSVSLGKLMCEVEANQPSIRPKRMTQPQSRFLPPPTLPPALNTQMKPGVARNHGAPEKPSLCARCAMTAQNCWFSQMANGLPRCKKPMYKQAVGVHNNREGWLCLSVH